MKKKLVVIGSINIDHILNVSSFPRPGETVSGEGYQIAFGGKGANQAVAAGRCGANIQFIAAVGNDVFGDEICQQFVQDHIDICSVGKIDQAKTGVALIFVDQKGENSIGIYAGANAFVTTDYIYQYRQDIIDADALLVQLETPLPAIEYAIRLAKDNNTTVIVNPAPAKALSDMFLSFIDIITPNETETEQLTGITISSQADAAKAADYLHQKGISIVIITLGSQGAWVSQCHHGYIEGSRIKSYPVTTIDTIAAGDTFNGMLATAILEGKSLSEAVSFANAAAALSVTKKGAQPSIPWREEIETFIQQK